MTEGFLLACAAVVLACWMAYAAWAEREIARLRRIVRSLARRVYTQSELLARRAERVEEVDLSKGDWL